MEEEGTWKLAAVRLPENDMATSLRLSLTSLSSKASTVSSPTFAGRHAFHPSQATKCF